MANHSTFRDLKVWRDSMVLVEEVYALSSRFPADEHFGLTAQFRRAAVSIPSNIGEGQRRKRRRAFLYHLDIALGSQAEVEVQLEIAARLNFVARKDADSAFERVAEIGRMLNGLIESLQVDRPGTADY
jgi:four helix bundle protein